MLSNNDKQWHIPTIIFTYSHYRKFTQRRKLFTNELLQGSHDSQKGFLAVDIILLISLMSIYQKIQ